MTATVKAAPSGVPPPGPVVHPTRAATSARSGPSKTHGDGRQPARRRPSVGHGEARAPRAPRPRGRGRQHRFEIRVAVGRHDRDAGEAAHHVDVAHAVASSRRSACARTRPAAAPATPIRKARSPRRRSSPGGTDCVMHAPARPRRCPTSTSAWRDRRRDAAPRRACRRGRTGCPPRGSARCRRWWRRRRGPG